MSVRTSVVWPAPRSPESVTKSPACSELAMSMASRRVACSSGSATEKLDVADVVRAITMEWLSRCCGYRKIICLRLWTRVDGRSKGAAQNALDWYSELARIVSGREWKANPG